MLETLSKKLGLKTSLAIEEIAFATSQLIDEKVSPGVKADFLCALAEKGETVEEIAAFANELRARSVPLVAGPKTRAGEILDVCGTGGDRLNTFNISTTVAIVLASAEVRVAKHGNRAITSRSGSADVLEALGIPIDLTPEEAALSLEHEHFAFFFAPKYHPSFKHIAPARKLCAERGRRTIFNLLGPLLNPMRATVQLIGVPRSEWCEPIARVLQFLGVKRGQVVCGETPHGLLDELSILGDNTVAEFYPGQKVNVIVRNAKIFGLQPARLEDLQGGDAETNARIIKDILEGKERGPKRDAVLINAAAALVVANKSSSWNEARDLAAMLVDSGKAAAKLRRLRTRFRLEVGDEAHGGH